MSSPGLSAGDKVVDLARLARSSSLLAGAVASAASVWILKHSVLWSLTALVSGAAAGLALGWFLGRVSFPAGDGEVLVVRLGPGALPVALKAGLTGGVCSGIVVGAISAALSSHAWPGSQLVANNVLIGAAIGALSAYIATRP